MDIILYNIIIGFGCLFLGYFFGSIPTGIILCKAIFHKDPRNGGSGNSGGTNVGRQFGKVIGLFVILLDAIKTILPMLIVFFVFKYSPLFATFEANLGAKVWNDGQLYLLLAPLGACIGHCYPIYANFNGGKAVASYAGFVAGTSWLSLIMACFGFFGTLKTTKYVSLSSMIGATIAALMSWVLFLISTFVSKEVAFIFVWGNGSFITCGWEYAIVSTLLAILLIVRHSPNIVRLKNKTESKIKWMK